MSRFNGLIGFAGTIIGLYWFGQSTATAPKYTTDDIMYKLANEFSGLNYKVDSGFADVLNTMRSHYQEVMNTLNNGFGQIQRQLSPITAKLGDLEMAQYQAVDNWLSQPLSMTFNSTALLI